MRFIFALTLVFLSTLSHAQLTESVKQDIECLALNIYHESRDQDDVGQVAVGFVTLNRVKSRRYPNTICGVVKQGYKPGRRDCHFSWYCDGKSDIPTEPRAWKKAQAIAAMVLHNHDYISDPTNGATHYHTLQVEPWWANKLSYNGTIGDHIFYVEGVRGERIRSNK